jgi:hypothetical protein
MKGTFKFDLTLEDLEGKSNLYSFSIEYKEKSDVGAIFSELIF